MQKLRQSADTHLLNVIKAAFEACVRCQCPPIFIASRNQVDLKSLGHGYLMGGMDQSGFVEILRKAASDAGYSGPLFICRDHGGPWQRNAELDQALPVGLGEIGDGHDGID